MAGALVSMGDIGCELETEESQGKIWKDEDLEKDIGLYSKDEEKQQGILCRAGNGIIQLIFLEQLSVPLFKNYLIFFLGNCLSSSGTQQYLVHDVFQIISAYLLFCASKYFKGTNC